MGPLAPGKYENAKNNIIKGYFKYFEDGEWSEQ